MERSEIDRSGSIWRDIPDRQWRDWKWQMGNRLRSADQLSCVVRLTKDELIGLQSSERLLRTDITPYFCLLLDPENEQCPIRKQVIPRSSELIHLPYEQSDPLAEDRDSPAPGVIHRYPDRVALVVTSECAAYCRFCTRSRLVGKPIDFSGLDGLSPAFQYIKDHTEVRDVLLTGGDPFLLPDVVLGSILAQLRAIKHIEIIRISTRVPIFLPQRVTPDLVKTISQSHPVWVNVNCNHPKELTSDSRYALAALADGGIPLGAQSVLMAGVNDCPNVMRDLVHGLVLNRVRPYYLYQCDPVFGSSQFSTPISTGIELLESLRGHTSGICVPTFVVDSIEGGGKVPISPSYIVSQSRDRVILRDFNGKLHAHHEPAGYVVHDQTSCVSCAHRSHSSPERYRTTS